MNLTKKLTIVLAAVAAACMVRADTSASADSSGGTLGQRYGELSFTDQTINHVTNDAYSLDLGFNFPTTKYLDLGAQYSYSWLNSGGTYEHSNIIATDATAYLTYAGVKPFVAAQLGYEFDRVSGSGAVTRSNFGIWGLAAGVEIPSGPVSITPFVSYQDDFQSTDNSTQAYDFGVGGNYWFSRGWGIFAEVAYEAVLHSNLNSWNWTVGVRQKF